MAFKYHTSQTKQPTATYKLYKVNKTATVGTCTDPLNAAGTIGYRSRSTSLCVIAIYLFRMVNK
jgi:hypothetical protein